MSENNKEYKLSNRTMADALANAGLDSGKAPPSSSNQKSASLRKKIESLKQTRNFWRNRIRICTEILGAIPNEDETRDWRDHLNSDIDFAESKIAALLRSISHQETKLRKEGD